MLAENYIIELLRLHNCVIVPNFGGFIANYQSAFIDTQNNCITPPSKQVIFNSNLLSNDGLLANYIARQKSISYPESMHEIELITAKWKSILELDKRLDFGELGFLYIQDGTMVFKQNREINLWLNAFGLESTQYIAKQLPRSTSATKNNDSRLIDMDEKQPTTTIELTNERVIDSVQENKNETEIIPLKKEKKSRKKWDYIAAACAIPFLFYTYWIPMETNFLETGNITLADFNPFRKSQTIFAYKKREVTPEKNSYETYKNFESIIADVSADVEVYNYKFDETLYIPVKLIKKEKKSTLNKTTESNKNAPYQLITGCFSIENNANTLVSELSNIGYSAYILDKNKGLYRVAVNGFYTNEEARNAKVDLQSKSYSSWILKNN